MIELKLVQAKISKYKLTISIKEIYLRFLLQMNMNQISRLIVTVSILPLFFGTFSSAFAGQVLEKKHTLPFCYMTTTDGRLIDLTAKCGFIQPQICSGSLGSASRDRVLTEFCKQNEKCLLTNTCNAQPIAPYGPRPGEAAG
jgi:hypothetical protein